MESMVCWKFNENLDKLYGKERIIDTPVSENAVTGAAVGASLCGAKPIVVHPRMDFFALRHGSNN